MKGPRNGYTTHCDGLGCSAHPGVVTAHSGDKVVKLRWVRVEAEGDDDFDWPHRSACATTAGDGHEDNAVDVRVCEGGAQGEDVGLESGGEVCLLGVSHSVQIDIVLECNLDKALGCIAKRSQGNSSKV